MQACSALPQYTIPAYGTLPSLGLLNTLIKQKNTQHYTPVGYGLEQSGPSPVAATPVAGPTRCWSTSTGSGSGSVARSIQRRSSAHQGGTAPATPAPYLPGRHHSHRRRHFVRYQPDLLRQHRRLPHGPAGRPRLPRVVRDHALTGIRKDNRSRRRSGAGSDPSSRAQGASRAATACRFGSPADSWTHRANSHSRTRPASRPARPAIRAANPAGSAASRSGKLSMCWSTS